MAPSHLEERRRDLNSRLREKGFPIEERFSEKTFSNTFGKRIYIDKNCKLDLYLLVQDRSFYIEVRQFVCTFLDPSIQSILEE